MTAFGLFKTSQSMALKIVGKISQSNLGFSERNEVISKSSLHKRFRMIFNDKIWKVLQPFMHHSIDLIFESISLKLKLLSKKKGIHNIDLLDIVFLLGEDVLIQEVVRKYKIPYNQDLLRKAIICDSVKSVRFLEQHGLLLNRTFLDEAAYNGSLEIIKYGILKGINPDIETLNYVAFNGDIDVIRYLVEKCNIKPTISTLDNTILGAKPQHSNNEANRYIFNYLKEESKSALSPPLAPSITPHGI